MQDTSGLKLTLHITMNTPAMKCGGVSIMLWEWFCLEDAEKDFRVDGKMKGTKGREGLRLGFTL